MSSAVSTATDDRLVRAVRRRLRDGKRVRRTLQPWGRLAVDRPLPFLCVYRRPVRGSDASTFRLVTSEASYLTCSAEKRQRELAGRLAAVVAETQTEKFGGFLIVEIWAGKTVDATEAGTAGALKPAFRIFSPRASGYEALTDSFEDALRRVQLGRKRATVATVDSSRRWPRGLPPILPLDEANRIGCLLYGLEVAPVYLDPANGDVFPRVLNQLRRKLSVALRRFFFEFAGSSTKADPEHFHVLGRRAVVKAVWEVDASLAEASESYEFLLLLTPVNGEQAWHQFERKRFERAPALHYRPLPIEPLILKRQLFKAPVERIEDPALTMIFSQKLDELDRQISMLQERNTPRFLPASVQLYGAVEDDLYASALELLQRIPARSREGPGTGWVNADAFARRAREEIAFLRSQSRGISSRVEIRPDVTGLMVSRGGLLISSHSRIPVSRVEALIQHEVGTHVLTYHNGRAQKFRLLASGLAGYDSLQEGLAVLAEYLVGGLSRPRLRLLAARVVAARSLLDGATFVDTFRLLHDSFGFAGRSAFTVTTRIHRCGGLTKDAVYLRGLRQILAYLGRGGDLEPLFVGKIASEHIPIVRELTWRRVLKPPPLIPRYMNRPESLERLKRLRRGAGVADLLNGGKL